MKRESNKLLASSIRRLIRAGRSTQLEKVINGAHPADLASVFQSLRPGQRRLVFETIHDPDDCAALLAELEEWILIEFLEGMDDDEVGALLINMAPDDAADVLLHLDDERKDRLLDGLPRQEQSEAETLLAFEPDSAGGLLSTDFLSLDEDTTAGEALKLIQQAPGEEAEVIFYIYVTAGQGQLVGVTSIRELVRSRRDTPLKDFMLTDVIRVAVDTDQEEVARLVARYNLLALPVVGAHNHLEGIVTVDDIIDVIREEATEDIMRMAGAGDEAQSPYDSPVETFRTRLPWLIPSFVAGSIGVLVVSAYEGNLIRFIPLAALIPMIMGLAGTVGNQSSTIVTRWLAMGKLEYLQLGRVVLRECAVGLAAGLAYGLLIGGATALFFSGHVAIASDPLAFGLVTGAAVFASMGLAATLGAGAPLLFDRMGWDPAHASGPFVTTTIDVLAIWIYLATAATILG